MSKTADLKVFITGREATCDECGEVLGWRAWITLEEEKGALCLACADLDHLVVLPAGDVALTGLSRSFFRFTCRLCEIVHFGAMLTLEELLI